MRDIIDVAFWRPLWRMTPFAAVAFAILVPVRFSPGRGGVGGIGPRRHDARLYAAQAKECLGNARGAIAGYETVLASDAVAAEKASAHVYLSWLRSPGSGFTATDCPVGSPGAPPGGSR